MFLVTDRFRSVKIEHPSKQSNLRHPSKLNTTPNIFDFLLILSSYTFISTKPTKASLIIKYDSTTLWSFFS